MSRLNGDLQPLCRTFAARHSRQKSMSIVIQFMIWQGVKPDPPRRIREPTRDGPVQPGVGCRDRPALTPNPQCMFELCIACCEGRAIRSQYLLGQGLIQKSTGGLPLRAARDSFSLLEWRNLGSRQAFSRRRARRSIPPRLELMGPAGPPRSPRVKAAAVRHRAA